MTKRIMCMECDGEGDFLVPTEYSGDGWDYVDCKECRGLGWVDPPEEEDENE